MKAISKLTKGILATILLLAGIHSPLKLLAQELAAVAPTDCAPVPANLVSWWRAEGNALDVTGTNNGTLINGAAFMPGKVGQAFSLNGLNQYLSAPDSPSLCPTNLTIEAWVNFSTTSSLRVIALKPYGAGRLDSYALWYTPDGELAGAVTTVTGEGPWLRYAWTPVLGTWHHVAYTFDSASSTQALYLDGTKVASGPVSGPIAYDTSPFQIGADIENGVESFFFGGLIDETALFNRALSTSEIGAIYNAGSAGKCPLPPTPTPTNCVSPPSGLVSWWRGEGDSSDALGAHNGTPSGGLSFASGEVGQAFNFNGGDAAVDLGDWFNLQTFSVGLWVKAGASQVVSADLIDNNHGDLGWHSWSVESANNGLRFGWGLYTTAGGTAVIEFGLKTNTWQYLVLTLDSNRLAQVYLDGQVRGATNLSAAINYDGTEFLRLGRFAGGGRYFNGQMDEVDVYNRALAVSEVQALYQSGSVGKCGPAFPPLIVAQPVGQTVFVGDTVSFAAKATGTAPLAYQWQANGTNVDGATAASLTLTNVQLAQAGNYALRVTNAFGTNLSANALLTVNPLPPCAPAPAGLVSWWRGEADASDAAGVHKGTASGGLSFAKGEVGQGFSFNGANAAMDLGNWFNLQTFSMALWVKAGAAQVASADLIDNNHGDLGWHSWSIEYVNTGLRFGWGLYLTGNRNGGVTFDLKTNTWQYLVLTLDSNRLAQVYLDGQLQGSTTLSGPVNYDGTEFLRLGRFAGGGRYFNGQMDEVEVYNRALAAGEIQAIYAAGVAGKCQETPAILVQPAGQMITETSHATFGVAASGTPQLRYQWRFNGTNITGATDSALNLASVQMSNAGLYSVRVTNAFGSVISSNALLTVNRIPVAQCADVVVSAGANCQADASINHGSIDLDGDPITVRQVPPGPYPLGTNRVTLTVTDDKGASNSCSALVIVRDQTPPELTCPANIVVTNAHNSTTSIVTFSPTARDNCSGVGQPVCLPPSGSAFGLGTHTVNVTVSDAAGNTNRGSFTVTVMPGNVAPVPVIEVSPLAAFPGYTNLIVIAPDGTNALVYFNGSKSYDPDDTNCLYFWSEGTNLFSTSVVATNVLTLGSHTITLRLDDTFPLGTSSASVTVEVISPEQALDIVVALAEDSDLAHNRLQPLLATLNAIAASLDRGNLTAAINQLEAFQNKVLAQVARGNPDVADALIQAAQQIIDSLSGADGTPAVPARLSSVDRQADGKLRMKFAGKAARVHLVQASTNLKDWETIGVAHDNGDGTFDYEDPAAARLPGRFYRILSP